MGSIKLSKINDHIFGNVEFDAAYMNLKDLSVAYKCVAFNESFLESCDKYGVSMTKFLPIKQGDTFNLGGLTLEIIDIPGHTPGSVLVLLKEDRILFTGDAINRHLWMQQRYTRWKERMLV